MTCIVGVEEAGVVYIGGDSAGTDGHLNRTIIKDPKVFVRGNVAFGVCGQPKVMDVLAHVMEIPKHPKGMTDRAYLVGVLVPAIRESLKKFDCVFQSKEHGICFNGALLIGYNGNLYNLETNFQLITCADGFDCVGSGASFAKGAMNTSGHLDPEERIIDALEVSTRCNAGVAPPFVIVKVGKRK